MVSRSGARSLKSKSQQAWLVLEALREHLPASVAPGGPRLVATSPWRGHRERGGGSHTCWAWPHEGVGGAWQTSSLVLWGPGSPPLQPGPHTGVSAVVRLPPSGLHPAHLLGGPSRCKPGRHPPRRASGVRCWQTAKPDLCPRAVGPWPSEDLVEPGCVVPGLLLVRCGRHFIV